MQSDIHCKVHGADAIRRFTLSELTYASLVKQVQQFFGVQDSFVLKYKDNEDDFVTLSSDSELLFAVSLMSGKALQLYLSQGASVVVSEGDQQQVTSFNNLEDNFHHRRRDNHKHKHKRENNGKHHRNHKSKCGGNKRVCLERKRERITKKIETLTAMSLSNPKNERTTERIAFLQSKLESLSVELSSQPSEVAPALPAVVPMVDSSLVLAVSSLSLEGPQNNNINNDNNNNNNMDNNDDNNNNSMDNNDDNNNDDELASQIFEIKEKIHQLKDSLHEARQNLRKARGVDSEDSLNLSWEAFRAKQDELRAEVNKLHDLKGKRNRRNAKRGRKDYADTRARENHHGHHKHGRRHNHHHHNHHHGRHREHDRCDKKAKY